MPLNLDYVFLYQAEPIIDLIVADLASGLEVTTFALFDTGAELSLFDERIAHDIGLNLADAQIVRLRGISGVDVVARRATVRLRLLDEEDLSVILTISFAPNVERRLGNLLGLDILSQFDFGISHANSIGYLGRALA